MNRILIISAAALIALPLSAATEKVASKPAAKPAAAPAADPSTTPKPGDSPLVAAAKRAALKRQQKAKGQVITNATLTTASSAPAHISTTNAQQFVSVPQPVMPGQESAEVAYNVARAEERKRAALEAEAKKKAEAARLEKLARAAAFAENEGFLDDPGLQEKQLEETAAQQPAPPPQN
jgi:hypothetical protein